MDQCASAINIRRARGRRAQWPVPPCRGETFPLSVANAIPPASTTALDWRGCSRVATHWCTPASAIRAPKARRCTSRFHRGITFTALLLGGQQVMSSLYPGFTEQLCELGAARWHAGTGGAFIRPHGKVYSMALGSVREPRDLGFDAYNESRGLIEHCARHFTQAHPGIAFATESTV